MSEEKNVMCVVFAYSRNQAIEDGVLIDISALANEAGLRFPVAITRAVFEKCVAVPTKCPWQSEAGRAWDVLNMLMWAIRRAPNGSEVWFEVLVQNDDRGPRPVQLKSVCGPGDDLEPVITIMLPEED